MIDGPSWRVRIEVFEGPLELLLTLVRREEIDIGRVMMSRITGQYLEFLAERDAVDLSSLADFCERSATLMRIKSRFLLPRGDEDEDDEPDPEELLQRLREYRRYRQVATRLQERERTGRQAFERAAPPPEVPPPPVTAQDHDVSLDDLAEAFRTAMTEAATMDEATDEPPVRPHRVRLRERFADIRDMLLERGRVTFRDVVLSGRPPDAPAREFVIISFLALLELLRRWAVDVAQDELFGEIVIVAGDALATVPLPGEGGSFEDIVDEASA